MEERQRLSRTSSFSHNNILFALLSVDGRLRVWDVISGKVLREFSATSRIESSCTCLTWSRNESRRENRQKEPRAKKKKTQTNHSDESTHLELIVGTKNGSVFTYDYTGDEIISVFKERHSDRVNCLDSSETDLVYTCSDDKHIVEWSWKSNSIKSKWKGDKFAVHSICVGPNNETILSAGTSIKLWSLKTKDLLFRFNGHSTPVSILKFSTHTSITSLTSSFGSDGYYFLSGAVEDRVVNIWHIDSEKKNRQAVKSLRSSAAPVFIDLSTTDDNGTVLCVGCQDGKIHFYEEKLHEHTSHSIEPKKTAECLLKEGKDSSPSTLLAGKIGNDLQLNLASGKAFSPLFHKFVYSEVGISEKIINEVSMNFLDAQKKPNEITIDYPATTKNAKYIGPHSLPISSKQASPVIDINGNEEDRQKTNGVDDIISMEERINAVTPKEEEKKKKATPSAGSFSQMLVQALHSSDDVLLNEIIFKCYKDAVLRNTIKRVPQKLIGKLLTLVIDKLLKNPGRANELAPWLRITMGVHLTHILSSQTLCAPLQALYQLLKVQQEVQPDLVNVHGKIDLLFSHVSNNKNTTSDDEDVKNAEVVFNDESEDETEDLFGRLVESDAEIELNPEELKDSSSEESENESDNNGEHESDMENKSNSNNINDEKANESDEF